MSAYSITSRGLPQGVLATMDDLLFSASEPGAWYDPSDLSTLFQDAAGTIPVTAVEQPVGRILDKSGRGNHATQATTTNRPVHSRRVNAFMTTQAVSNGTVTAIPDAFGPGFDGLQVTRTGTGDEVYLPINPSDVMGGSKYTLKVHLKKGGQNSPTLPGTFYTSAGYCNFELDWVSGAISYGSTSGGFTITNHSSVRLSGDSYYVTLDFAVPAGVPSVTWARIYLWAYQPGVPSYIIGNPQFSLATDAHLHYQRVTSATDYDADPSKFPAYLRFDGVDDALQTGNIDFTSTDKMTVWAGITKLSDAANGMVYEFGSPESVNSGTFSMWAPINVASAPLGVTAKGTSRSVAATTTFSGVASGVVVHDISLSAPRNALRLNGAALSTQTTALGGSFGNFPFNIGSRAGTTTFFNGHLYSLIVRGAQSSLLQIEATELYIKQKMRMP